MPQIDIDSKIDWKQFYSRYFSSMKPTGKNKMLVKCPFHDDAHASMWFNTENGCWKCEACGESGNAQVFLEKKEGLDAKTAYTKLLKLAGEYAPPKKKNDKFSIDTYCQLKKLPVEFIANLGVKNYGKGIAIPYMDESGQVVCTRHRYANKMLTWNRGARVNLYGLWFLQRIRELGYVVLVEGESDSQTLWLHKVPTLGVPGASTFQTSWVQYLTGLKKVYIYVEPELSGETMLKHTCSALFEGEFEGEVYRISIPDYKDPSDLHVNVGEEFDNRWKAVMESAQPVDIQEVAVKIDNTFPGAPVQLRKPVGWRFSDKGIEVMDEKTSLWSVICRTPILLSRRMKSLDTGEEKMEIVFERDNKWQRAVVQRSTIFQSRTIPQLSDIGITITSENAKLIVKYLGALEAENIDVLKVNKCVSQLGWYGKHFLPGLAGELVIDVDRSSQKWVNAYCKKSSFDDWKEKCSRLEKIKYSGSLWQVVLQHHYLKF